MDSLVGYGSDDDNETERYGGHHYTGSGGSGGGSRRRDDDTNYDDVNMDMSEDSQAESEPELPQAEPQPSRHSYDDRRGSDDSRDRDRDRERERDYKRRESPPRRPDRPDRPDRPGRSDRSDRPDRRSPRRDKQPRSDRDRGDRGRGYDGSSRRGLLGDRPDDKPPSLMDLKPFGGDPPPTYGRERNSQDARDAASPRFIDRTSDRRDRDRDRGERERDRGERERDRGEREDRGDRDRSRERSREKSHGRSDERYGRGPPRGAAYPPPSTISSSSLERRGSPPSGDYRPTSYKVNRKLEVMEKMGLQIKTPDGSMATAQQLRSAATTAPPHQASGPSYFNNAAISSSKILDQVQKRKMLWSNKSKDEAAEAAKWSGTRFAQDQDGKQVSKFMRLMGIKEPAAVAAEAGGRSKEVDPIKKQEELFQAMQAQYEVARATTHTMRGVGLGFQRGQF